MFLETVLKKIVKMTTVNCNKLHHVLSSSNLELCSQTDQLCILKSL